MKSCVDSSCSCKSFNTSPVGTANDCDGDGTPNSSDTSDIYKAEFIGPGGDGSTFYSELLNRDESDLVFDCASNPQDADINICLSDEISLNGLPSSAAPEFRFASMAASASLSSNRYFQYRVVFESEDNSACSGLPCLPELSQVQVGPNPRYFGGSPVLTSTDLLPVSGTESISFDEAGACSPRYQLSPDGSTYYYYDGNDWIVAPQENLSYSSVSSVVSAELQSFFSSTNASSLAFKAFLPSDTSQSCELQRISISP